MVNTLCAYNVGININLRIPVEHPGMHTPEGTTSYLLSVGNPARSVPRSRHPGARLRSAADGDRGRGAEQGTAGGASAGEEGHSAVRDDARASRRHAGRADGRRQDDRLPGTTLEEICGCLSSRARGRCCRLHQYQAAVPLADPLAKL